MSLTPQDLEQIVLETDSPKLRETLHALIQKINELDDNASPLSESSGTLAEQPTLTAGDAGFLYHVTDYNHTVRWNGTIWEFAPGDVGNGFKRNFAFAPQEAGWALMDGSTVNYLVVGSAALTTASIVLPDLDGSEAFDKSTGSYTGSIDAAVAANISGSTASGGTGNTGQPSASQGIVFQEGTGASQTLELHNSISTHTHNGPSHSHGAGSLANNTAARPPSIGWLPYFRQ